MLIEAVVHVGIVGGIADALAEAAGGNLTVATMGILWFSALASAIVDQHPYTATAILSSSDYTRAVSAQEPLWWSASLSRFARYLGSN